MIITQTDRKTLPACLRVSSQWFDLAGKALYSDVSIGWVDATELMRGAGIASTAQEIQKSRDAKTGYKRQLLKYVQTITIGEHTCPTDKAARSKLTQGARLMTGLKQTILCPEAEFKRTMPLCGKKDGCPILAGIRCHSVTIQDIRRKGASGGPLEQFTPIFDYVKHATLVIQPLAPYIGKGGPVDMARKYGRPQDLAVPTRNLESVRIIVAMSNSDIESINDALDMSFFLEKCPKFAEVGHLQDFLAAFINLHPSKIEIYIFNEFSQFEGSRGILELDQFREQLAVKVDAHYHKSIAEMTEANQLKPEHSSWSANYQVFDLEHYFARPDLASDIDIYLRHDWEMDLDNKRDYEMDGDQWESDGSGF
jgi:hypothetical protein